MAIEILTNDEIVNKVITLKGEENIFVSVGHELCRDLKYIIFKRQGLENLFISYINSTVEEANKINFDTYADRVAKSQIDERDLVKHIGLSTLGEDLYQYLSSSSTPQSFYIDFEQNQMVIYNAKDSKPLFQIIEEQQKGCGCSDGSCDIH